MVARKRKGQPIHGWAVIDKPAGLTSTDVVTRVRRSLDAAKAGHAGTLDPIATGILPVALGEATKTVPFLMDATKVYRFTARWGEARATDDSEGAVTGTSAARPAPDDIRAALSAFEGEILQRPPAFSAIKVDGARAYDLARAGEQFDLESRLVFIEEAKLIDAADPDRAVFEITCGKGTFVRALVRVLALKLGTLGHVEQLRRTRVGPFSEAEAVPLDKFLELGHSAAALAHLFAVETPLDDIPAVPITAGDAGRLRSGQAIFLRAGMKLPPMAPLEEGATEELSVLCTLGHGRPVALCAYDAGQLRPVRVFNI
jgi:tRNA pseudouridine55 synthase